MQLATQLFVVAERGNEFTTSRPPVSLHLTLFFLSKSSAHTRTNTQLACRVGRSQITNIDIDIDNENNNSNSNNNSGNSILNPSFSVALSLH